MSDLWEQRLTWHCCDAFQHRSAKVKLDAVQERQAQNSTALILLTPVIVRWPARACEEVSVTSLVIRNCSSARETRSPPQVSLRPASWTGDAAPQHASESLSQYLASQVGPLMYACAVVSPCVTLH